MSEQELDSGSFNKNYRVLKETADWLSKQEEPDIDQLVPRVERAMQAYRICKDRLDKVKETLGQYLQGDGARTVTAGPSQGWVEQFSRAGYDRIKLRGTLRHLTSFSAAAEIRQQSVGKRRESLEFPENDNAQRCAHNLDSTNDLRRD